MHLDWDVICHPQQQEIIRKIKKSQRKWFQKKKKAEKEQDNQISKTYIRSNVMENDGDIVSVHSEGVRLSF